jgi:hypothetical protein
MTAETKFSLTLAAMVFVMMVAAGIGFTFDKLERKEKEQKQEATGEGEEVSNNHQADRSTSQASYIPEHSNNDQRHGDQPGFQERQLRVAIGLNVITLALAIPAAFGLYILIGTLNATRIAADASRQQAIAAHESLRPWISTDTQDGMDDTLTLDFSKPNQTGIGYSLDIPLKNFGHSPATHVTPLAQLIWGSPEEIQNQLMAFGKYQCGSLYPLDSLLVFGTFVPPEARIFYPSPAAATLFGRASIKLGDKIQLWLILCVGYYNPSDNPPSLHHTCTRHRFRGENGEGDIVAVQGTIKGKFIPMNGGCAN